MPNHVTHRLNFTGDTTRFREAFFNKDGQFDFNLIIPCPKILDGTVSGGSTNVGRFLLTGTPDLSHYLDYHWVKKAGVTTLEELKAFLTERFPNALKEGQAALDAFAETGHYDWYTWSNENWGTKWNAYGHHDNGHRFDTAWSVPEPIFQELAKRPECEDLVIDITAFDEGWNFAYEGQIADGNYGGSYRDATDALYEAVYGEPPEHEDEE